MSQYSGDDTLIDLFREEVRTNCQILTEGLVAVEQGQAVPQRLEAMMRAAHSIKGAARVVNVPPGVTLSHAMEDRFVQAQASKLTLTSELVDTLLQCVDFLEGIAAAVGPDFAAWLEANQGRMTALLQQLENATQPDQSNAAPASPAPDAESPVASISQPPEPVASDAPAGEAASAKPVVGAATTPQADEAVVRVTARSLTRLMGLAGESLVESRWLPPFAKALLQLKKSHDQLADAIDGLGETVESERSPQGAGALLDDVRARLTACRELLAHQTAEFDRRMRDTDELSARLYREVISSRMRPFRDGVQGLPRLARDLARQLGKRVQLQILGEATEVDRDILERLDAPLTHLVRNAIDHGLETPEERQAAGKAEVGRLTIEATHSAGMLSIAVRDDGRGIDLRRLRGKVVERGLVTADMADKLGDEELLDFLFLPGFSTASAVSEISGRGVGLDVVHTMVQSVGGRVQVHAKTACGTTFQIQLPLTLSVLRAVVVDIAGEPYAFPHNRIDCVIRVARGDLRSLEDRQYVQVDGQNVGIVIGRQVLQLEGAEPAGEELTVVLLGERSARYGLVVDALLGEQDLVVRPVDRRLGQIPNVQAAAILDDGSPVLIVDADDLRRAIEKLLQSSRLQRADARAAAQAAHRKKRVLVIDDSITVREVERQLLANRGYEVEVAVDGMEGWNVVQQRPFDLVISDIDMPRLNGLELVRRIKATARLQAMPVVIVSYKDREEDRLRGLEAGANHYLAKSSFHDDTLVQVVRQLIGDAEA